MKAVDILTSLLETETPEYLAYLYNELNGWRWPVILGECPFPENALMSEANKYITILHHMIENKIGEYEIFKYLHCVKLGYSSERFENWWKNRINNVPNNENMKKMLSAILSLMGDEPRINHESLDKETIYQEYSKIKNPN